MNELSGIISGTHNNIFSIIDLSSKKEIIALKKKKSDKLAIGDSIMYVPAEQGNTITKIIERKNFIPKPPIANLDCVFLVFSINSPEYSFYVLDAFLGYYSLLDVKIILIFNKLDIANDKDVDALKIYQNIGYETYFISGLNLSNSQKEVFNNLIKNKTVAFIGNSGVGKSSLMNNLFEKNFIKTNIVSEKTQKGKQTTSQTLLYYHSKLNAFIIDTPGYSIVNIALLKNVELDNVFLEYSPYLGKCQYNNCKHISEPNCAIKEALNNNEIYSSRYESYLKIYTDIEKNKNTNY
jgi:ribosome biogenesis GTPase / thiamine phosphate phosphatase